LSLKILDSLYKMKLMLLISLTFIYHAKALSFDFVATEQPSGLRHHGKSRVQTICDPTRECSTLGTQSRSQCQRWNCCWVSNKCVAKTYFILDVDIGNCKYRFTEAEKTWYQSREECKSYGGDLIHKQFGPTGAAYHDEIRELITSTIDFEESNIWIGYTDMEKEGEWKLLNGELYDANDRNLDSLYYWDSGQPNNWNGNQHCGELYRLNPGDDIAVSDVNCYSTTTTRNNWIGLCEIC